MRLVWLFCALAATAAAQMRLVQVDAANLTGAIRSFQGVNDGPAPLLPQLPDATREYRDLRIDLVRTHDFFGPTDIDARWPNPDAIAKAVRADGARSIFPDWNADPEKEASYNFPPTDRVLAAIVNCGAEVYYRVGRSWSADPAPPPDFDKYANIVKHVAMHYNGGWAHGFHDKIRYWEFWNEPDLEKSWNPGFVQPFWTGAPQQFYALYEKVARALKSYDASLLVGAPGKAAGSASGPYREGLIAYCAARKVPLDFYSWHHYSHFSADPYDLARIARDVRRLLDGKGFPATAIHVTEWNIGFNNGPQMQASMHTAALIAAAQIYLQDSPMDRALYYRGDPGNIGFFDASGAYRKKAYVFRALGAMQDTPRRIAATGADTLGFAVLAGRSADGQTVAVLIGNYEIPEQYRKARLPNAFSSLPAQTEIRYQNNRGFTLRLTNLPWGKDEFTVRRYRTTETESWAEQESRGQGGTLEITEPLPPPGVEYIVLRRGAPGGAR